MGFKNNDSCLEKVDDDEPIFVLRAQDRFSIGTIQNWLAMAKLTLDPGRYNECRKILDEFAHWQALHPSRVKSPD